MTMTISFYLLIGCVVFIIDLLRALFTIDQEKALWKVFRGALSIFLWPVFVSIRILCLIGIIICLGISKFMFTLGGQSGEYYRMMYRLYENTK